MVFINLRSLIAVSILYHATSAFTQPTSASSRSTSLHATSPAAAVATVVPSWVDLGESLPSDSTSTPEQPLVTLKLMNEDDAAFLEAREVCAAVQSAGFGMLYGGNATTTAAETEEKRLALEAALDAMDDHLSKVTDGGPFLLGGELSGVDIEVIPTLERFRYQFPLLKNVTISSSSLRPNLQRWFEAIDASPAYASRVAGDEYSWTAVASTFLRIFGSRGNELTLEQNATIARVEAAATALTLDFVNDSGGADSTDDGYVAACREAAEKLIANHEAVVADCSRADPKSQKELGRSSNVERADLALRMIANSLLNNNSDVDLTLFRNKKDATEAAFALRTVAKRLSVPRDMGGPAAKVLRRRLMVLAQNMEANAKDSVRPLGIPRRSKFQSKL
mmetsp:Transcript_8150/g.10212  ORF Transcript_8150/g.10212 Transcript_8150/m.10212 type:complete len:393 (+) Transcript_8150:118-1296(+)